MKKQNVGKLVGKKAGIYLAMVCGALAFASNSMAGPKKAATVVQQGKTSSNLGGVTSTTNGFNPSVVGGTMNNSLQPGGRYCYDKNSRLGQLANGQRQGSFSGKSVSIWVPSGPQMQMDWVAGNNVACWCDPGPRQGVGCNVKAPGSTALFPACCL